MKLIAALLLLSVPAAAAPTDTSLNLYTDIGVSTGTTTTTSTGTSTATSTSTATGKNRAENWKASKFNDQLMSDQVNGFEMNQSASLTMNANVFVSCLKKNLSGRTDALCAVTPDHPECIGLANALKNATTCLRPLNPGPGVPCLEYGTKDFTMEEWIAFGNQYHTTMSSCSEYKAANDKTQTTKLADGSTVARLASLTTFGMPGASGTGPVGMANIPSDISGTSSRKEIALPDGSGSGASSTADALAGIDDGASYLGYDTGEIIKRTSEGQAFYHIVTNSPFASELKPKTLALLENGLTESSLVVNKARAAGRLPEPGGTAEGALAVTLNEPGAAPSEETQSEAVASSSWRDQKKLQTEKLRARETGAMPAVALPTGPIAPRTLFLAERIAMLEAAAKANSPLARKGLAGFPKSPGRTLASLNPDADLFLRIKNAYLRANGKIQFNRAAASELSQMEAPAIFQEFSPRP